jgi:hypothetical protein
MGILGGLGSLAAAAMFTVPITVGAVVLAVAVWAEETLRDLGRDPVCYEADERGEVDFVRPHLLTPVTS